MPEETFAAPLHRAAQKIPVPTHLSPEARATFTAAQAGAAGKQPRTADEWRAFAIRANRSLLESFDGLDLPAPAFEATHTVGFAKAYEILPSGVSANDPRVYLDVHGGALLLGAGEYCRRAGEIAAHQVQARVWAVDYRVPPDHPYPAALDDCVTVYRTLLQSHKSQNIVIGGISAGGNLAAATILRARDEGLPLPAAAVLHTPELDLTESGDSFQTNMGLDGTIVRSLMPENLLYAGGQDLRHPYLSPLFADFRSGFPPTFVDVGTRDLFLSTAVRMNAALRAADIETSLYVIEAASHGGFPGSPESALRDREVRKFLERWWGIV